VAPDRNKLIMLLGVGFNFLVDADIFVVFHDFANILQEILKYKLNFEVSISILP
jgi:hypothetical protein